MKPWLNRDRIGMCPTRIRMDLAIKLLIGISRTDDRSPSKGDSRGPLGDACFPNTLRGRGDSPNTPIRTRAPLAH
eukprot:6033269-Heterocapsa_arctica.AAC.1